MSSELEVGAETRKNTKIRNYLEWEFVKLKNIVELSNGKKKPADSTGKIPIYGGNGIMGLTNRANFENVVIVGRVGAYCGSVFYEPSMCWVSDNAIAVKNKDVCDIAYIYYLFISLHLNIRSIGTSQPLLTQEILNSIEIRLPNIKYQRKIARCLRSLDEKIAKNKAINDNLHHILTTFYREMFGKCEQTTTISYYAKKIFSGGTPSTSESSFWNGEYNWLSSGETSQKYIINTEKSITQAGINNSSTKLASKYDVVIASAGQGYTRGQTSMLLTNTYVNQSIIVVHSDNICTPFIYWSLNSRYEELRVISNSNSIRGSLTTKMINSFPIPRAENGLIRQFSELAWSAIFEIEKNCLEIKNLTTLRDTLLPKLMSGEIDVSEVEI